MMTAPLNSNLEVKYASGIENADATSTDIPPTYSEFQKDSRNRVVLKKSLKLRSVNLPVVASRNATNTTWTTGITRKINKNRDINSMTAACPG
jgi:hypothetical protein